MQLAPAIPTWTVGDRLRKARETAGLDQDELGALIGASRRTVSNYECDRAPKIMVRRAWALATGVPIEWIETGQFPAGPTDGGTALGFSSSTSSPVRLLRAA